MKPFLAMMAILTAFSSFAVADDDTTDLTDREDYDPTTPYYQIMPPSWAFGLRGAFIRFPTPSASGGVYELFAEKLIHYQKIGVFSLGLNLGVAPIDSTQYDRLKFGGLLRYQLHFMPNQILVPTAALVMDGFRMKDPSGNAQTFSSFGFLFGGLLNLGFFDSSTSREGFEGMGLLRSYLTVELRPLNISNTSISVNSVLWYFGLRLETE